MGTDRKLYTVSIFDTQADGSSIGLAVWKRWGVSAEDVIASTTVAAEREFPTASVEVWINSRTEAAPVRSTLEIVERTMNMLEHEYGVDALEDFGVPTAKEIAAKLDASTVAI